MEDGIESSSPADTNSEENNNIISSPTSKTSLGTSRISEIESFLFPSAEQHPLSTDRLILIGLYGPLIDGNLKGGKSMARNLNPREIQIMCKQIEEEDIIQIYVPHGSSNLTNAERLFILNQANFEAKVPKGKALLPQMTRADFRKLIHKKADFESDQISFHDLQQVILKYRQWRIKKLRRKEPIISIPDKVPVHANLLESLSELEAQLRNMNFPILSPEGRHVYSILDPSRSSSNESVAANLTLVRQSERDRKLFASKDRLARESGWDDTGSMTGTGLPSMVGDLSLKSTRRKYTLY